MKNIIFDNCDWNFPKCGGYCVCEGRIYWHIYSLSNYQGTREFKYSLPKSKYSREQVTDPDWIEEQEEYFIGCYESHILPDDVKIEYLGKVY